MAVKEKLENVSEEIEWNVETEVQLFYAMAGHKPVGPNKHFHMACILDKFKSSINKNVTAQVIWKHLDTMYDMQALDDTESIPFPNEEKDFKLPTQEFGLKQIKSELDDPPTSSVQVTSTPPSSTQSSGEQDKKEKVEKVKKVIKKEKESKDEIVKESKEIKKEKEETKEKKIIKEKREQKEKDIKIKKEAKELPKEIKKEKELPAEKEATKTPKSRLKEKNNRDTPAAGRPSTPQTVRERRGSAGSSKRSLRGSVKDESPSQSATPPPIKRRRI